MPSGSTGMARAPAEPEATALSPQSSVLLARHSARARPHRFRLGVRRHWRTGAHEVAVAEGGVDPAHGWPGLVFPETGHRIGGTLPRIGTIPGILDHLDQGVRPRCRSTEKQCSRKRMDLPSWSTTFQTHLKQFSSQAQSRSSSPPQRSYCCNRMGSLVSTIQSGNTFQNCPTTVHR